MKLSCCYELFLVYAGLHALTDCAWMRRMRRDTVLRAVCWRVDTLRQSVGMILLLAMISLLASLHLLY